MQFSPTQDQALQTVNSWFKNDSKKQQIFRLFGWAGTGKTTLAKHFAKGIPGTVKFASFTGKAAHVMAQKGCIGASTIHRMIYTPKIASKNRLKQLEEQLIKAKTQPEHDRKIINTLLEEIKAERNNAGKMNFALNLASDLRGAALLILDECSMVSEIMGKDLESFGVPILVLGDPEQLPPIYGAGYFTEQKPDKMLTEIHRQALDNPIIAISALVREGRPLPLGDYGNSKVIDKKISSDEMVKHDIILTGLRETKRACDNHIRKIRGMSYPLPQKGDRIMCIRNNHDLGLLNGQIWECVSDAVSMGDTVSLHIKSTEDNSTEELAVTANSKLFAGQKLERWEHEDDIQEFEFAYAITVHKSQGSQWNNILLYDQKHRFPNWSDHNRRRWLYTGITRAAERITVMRL